MSFDCPFQPKLFYDSMILICSHSRGETELLPFVFYTVLLLKGEGLRTLAVVFLLLSAYKQILVSRISNQVDKSFGTSDLTLV